LGSRNERVHVGRICRQCGRILSERAAQSQSAHRRRTTQCRSALEQSSPVEHLLQDINHRRILLRAGLIERFDLTFPETDRSVAEPALVKTHPIVETIVNFNQRNHH
jgi:hypothetical protein